MNEENVIFVGDLNCKVYNEKDKGGKIIKDILQRFDLIDIWSELKPNKNCLTWCDGSGSPQSRLDYVIISEHFCYDPENIYLRRAPNISDSNMSDHMSTKLNISFNIF